MSTKYYAGPSGVYYNAKDNRIYTLKKTGTELFDLKRGKMSGAMYEYEDSERIKDEVAIIGTHEDMRIGDL